MGWGGGERGSGREREVERRAGERGSDLSGRRGDREFSALGWRFAALCRREGKIQICKENFSLKWVLLVELVVNETKRTSRSGWGRREGKIQICKENFSLR